MSPVRRGYSIRSSIFPLSLSLSLSPVQEEEMFPRTSDDDAMATQWDTMEHISCHYHLSMHEKTRNVMNASEMSGLKLLLEWTDVSQAQGEREGEKNAAMNV